MGAITKCPDYIGVLISGVLSAIVFPRQEELKYDYKNDCYYCMSGFNIMHEIMSDIQLGKR